MITFEHKLGGDPNHPRAFATRWRCSICNACGTFLGGERALVRSQLAAEPHIASHISSQQETMS